jgi:hypothetical protein
MAVGEKAASFPTTVFSGSDGWLARVGHSVPSSVGDTANPFGAGAAACLAAANIFRALFVSGSGDLLDENAAFSTWSGERSDGNDGPPLPEQVQLPSDAVLVGLGAVGHGVLWALGRSPLAGRLQLVDPETVELSNLQRYVLGQRSDDRHPKTEIAKSALATTGLEPVSHPSTWAEFVARDGYDWPLVLVGLDSARDRRAVQAALPGWVANAWTQPGDLGVSVRSRFGGEGACVSCLYLPSGPAPNEDELVAKALGVPNRQQQIRDLLHHGSPVPADLLEAISTGLDVPIQALRGSRDMASESCTSRGSAVAPLLDWSGWDARSKRSMYRSPTSPRLQECFSRAAGPSCTWRRPRTDPDHPDRRPSALSSHLTQPAKASDARCICRDPDYVAVFEAKWPKPQTTNSVEPDGASHAHAGPRGSQLRGFTTAIRLRRKSAFQNPASRPCLDRTWSARRAAGRHGPWRTLDEVEWATRRAPLFCRDVGSSEADPEGGEGPVWVAGVAA